MFPLFFVCGIASLPTTAEFEQAAKPIWLVGGGQDVADLQAVPAAGRSNHTSSSAVYTSTAGKAPPMTPGYAWFRREVETPVGPSTSIKRASVLITAQAGDAKILSAYKLWINNIPIADGPGRSVDCNPPFKDPMTWHCTDARQGYDVIDVTTEVTSSTAAVAVLAIQGYFQSRRGGAVRALLWLEHVDGTERTVGTDESWSAFNASTVMNPSGNEGSQYPQPREDVDMRYYPTGWRLPRFNATLATETIAAAVEGGVSSPSWVPASEVTSKSVLSASLLPKKARAVTRSFQEKVAAIMPITNVTGGAGRFRYRVDLGREIQGGIVLRLQNVPAAAAGQQFEVLLGETLMKNGSVLWKGSAGFNYREVWTLREGVNQFDFGQEYKEFRWCELVDIPVPLTIDNIGAWVVRYPMGDAGLASNASAAAAAAASNAANERSHNVSLLTTFTSSSQTLNDVYDLGSWTIVSTSLGDVNTDSNTRQRDNCEMDAFIAAMGQLWTSNGNAHLVARSFEFSMQNGYHMAKHWTEFKLVSVFAVHQLLLHDFAVGLDIATRYYDTIATLTLIPSYYVASEGLAVKGTPGWQQGNFPNSDCAACEPDLVDYPPKYLDGFYSPNNRSTVDNVYIAEAAGAMAAIATAVGKAADAAKYAAIGAKIRATVVAQFFDAKTGLFIDGDMSTHSALSAQYFPAAFGFVGASAASSSSSSNYSAAGDVSDMQAAAVGSRARALSKKTYKQKRATTIGNVKPMLDLIENKTSIARASEPACSCMGGHWLLQGLYNIGATTEDAAQGARAAAMAQAFIESPWTWRLMIAAGATTTMEVWTTRDKPNLSWSHPWCSAPANAIPRLLMGVAPIAVDYARFQVWPQPGNLTSASLSLPTKHGVIAVNVNQTETTISASISVPRGTAAFACLPPTGVAKGTGRESSSSSSSLTVDGQKVAAPPERGRMLCAPTDLVQGDHVLVRTDS